MRLVKAQFRPSRERHARVLCIAALAGLYLIIGAVGAMPASAQQPLPPPLPPMTSTPVSTTGSLSIEQATTVAPPVAGSCACDRALYTCSSFSNWSAAQTCFNQCRITVGYDIHGLDEDGDGVVCEMAMDGPSPFTLPTLPAPLTSPVDAGGAADGAAAPPLIQDTTPSTPTVMAPTPTPVTAPTVTELPAYPAESVPDAEEVHAQPWSPMRVLLWALMIAVVAVAAGALVWLRRRG